MITQWEEGMKADGYARMTTTNDCEHGTKQMYKQATDENLSRVISE